MIHFKISLQLLFCLKDQEESVGKDQHNAMAPFMHLKHEYFVIVPKTVGQKAANTPCKTVFHQLCLFQNIIHEALLNALAVITDQVIFQGRSEIQPASVNPSKEADPCTSQLSGEAAPETSSAAAKRNRADKQPRRPLHRHGLSAETQRGRFFNFLQF